MITMKVDIDAAYNMVLQQRQVPHATRMAMNSWMFATNRFLKQKIDNYLEGGAENFTKNGFMVNKVKNKRDLRGNMYVSLQHKKPYLDRYYLKNIIEGGKIIPPRPDRKKLMQPIPGRVTVNNKGNLKRKTYASFRNQERNYFYGIPKGREGENYRGLWKRLGVTARNPGGKQIKMIIALGKENRYTRKLFPAGRLAAAEFDRNFWKYFAIEYRKAITTRERIRRSKL